MNEQSTSEPEQTPSPDATPAPPEPQPTEPPPPVSPPPEPTTAEAPVAKPAPAAGAEKVPAEKAPAEKAPVEKAPEKVPAEKVPAEKARTDKARTDKARTDKARTDKARTDKARTDKAPSTGPSARQPGDGRWWWGVGRRKAAVARVRIRPGDGKFIVNKRPYDKYLNEERDQNDLMAVLHKTKTAGSVDVHVNVRGGGFTGQAGAIVLGLGRALRKFDESLEPILRDNGFLTRDPRKVERKKYGQPGARKRFQFSKR
jgi:small subunit ribosomal protein S9